MTKYKIKTITVGNKKRFHIQKRIFSLFGFTIWDTVINPIVTPPSPFEFKFRLDAELKAEALERN